MESLMIDLKNIFVAYYIIIAVAVLGRITASPYLPAYGRSDMRAHWQRSIETPYRVKWNRGVSVFFSNDKKQK